MVRTLSLCGRKLHDDAVTLFREKGGDDRELDEAAEPDWLCVYRSQSHRNDGVYARSGSVLLLFNVYGLGIR